MKRSPASSCSSTSSSSSCVGSDIIPHRQSQPEKPKSKRTRRNYNNNNNNNQENCLNANSPGPGRRSSIYRGVTRHRWTGRFEAHLWDKTSWNNIQNKKGRQVYLGAYDNEEAAAHTYDLAALKYWGPETTLNFPIETYTKELEEMQKVSKEEYLASLRRRSSGFSRGVSKYRGVARHHHNGRWEARIGRVFGNKYLYLGTYNTQEEAAAAYDMAAIEYRGANAVTNFDISNYIDCLKKKGISIDHIFKGPLPNCSIESEEAEVEQPPTKKDQEQEPEQEKKQVEEEEIASSQLERMQLPLCMDTSIMIAIDPIEEHNLAWSFCMDSGLTPLPMPDLPIENACELPDLFDDTGFEDNIDLIFDTCLHRNETKQECILDNTRCGVKEAGDSGSMEEENGKESLLSSASMLSSPSSSTTASVACNYAV